MKKWSTKLINKYFLLIFGVVSISILILFAYDVSELQTKVTKDAVLENAANNTRALESFRTLYTEHVVERVKAVGIEVTHDYLNKKGAIPLPATLSMEIWKHMRDNSEGLETKGMEAYLYSNYPFPWREDERATLDTFQKEALKFLKENSDKPYFQFVEYKGQFSLRYAKADLMRKSCVACHNSHPQSPKTDWKVGDLRGALEVILPVNTAAVGSESVAFVQNRAWLYIIMSIVFISLILFVVTDLKTSKNKLEESQTDLLGSLDELSAANDELEEFAYRTSHDLRSPLVSSIALLKMASKAIDKNNMDTAIKSIHLTQNSLIELDHLVQNILQLTETKNSEEEEQKVNVGELIDESLAKHDHMDNFERLDIQKQYLFKGTINVKKSRLALIIENMISNAIKYQDTQEKLSYINISTYRDKQNFVLETKDNGLGIPKEQQGKLFTMFKRFHNKVSFGSGLGLYMMKQSATILGGEISFEDNGKGSIFKLTIPLA